jgi:hypothetical protein
MANEPERPIEKLLRAAAKKRRDDAGAPFELHPATRRLLQGEVAQNFAKAQRQTRSFSEVLSQLWPRFAWGGAIFAVLAVTVYVLLPEPGKGKQEALLAKNESMSEARRAKEPFPPPTAAVPAVPAPPAPAMEAYSAAVAAAGKAQAAPRSPARRLGAEREELPADSLAAPLDGAAGEKHALAAAAQLADRQKDAEMGLAVSGGLPAQAPAGTVNGALERRYGLAGKPASSASLPAAPASPAPLAATPPAATLLAADESAKLTGEKFDQPTLQYKSLVKAASANRPSASPMAADDLSKAAGGAPKEARSFAVGQRFVQVAPEEEAKNGFADKATPAHPVLASFQLEQAGRELRIVDGDGSVYSGSVQLDDATRRARPVKAEAPAATTAARAPGRVFEEKAASSLDSDRLAPQTYSFRVAGTNRSLNKKVVFTGNLLAATNLNLSVPVATNFGIGGNWVGFQNAPAQQGFRPLLNSRISGKVVIGSSKAVEINALPTSP